jgi:CubicO group peptidase (beta-lactamase class C family)
MLEAALDYAGQTNAGAVVVLHGGRIVAERYWNAWDAATVGPGYSASKSLVSTLVGIAIEEGAIRELNQPAADFLPEWRGSAAHEAITIGHLLTMTSGIEGAKRSLVLGSIVRDERAFATKLGVEHAPGTVWDYHNSAYRLLFPILERATRKSLDAYTREKLFEPLGMGHTRWGVKRRGTGHTFIETTARDAARYGLLVLRGGDWGGVKVVSREWLDAATHPTDPSVNPSYGRLWWLNGGSHHYLPLRPEKRPGPIFPGCPPDAIAALGKDDQKIYVVPSLDLVVTRLGDAADSSKPALSEFDAKFLGKVCHAFGDSGQPDTR